MTLFDLQNSMRAVHKIGDRYLGVGSISKWISWVVTSRVGRGYWESAHPVS